MRSTFKMKIPKYVTVMFGMFMLFPILTSLLLYIFISERHFKIAFPIDQLKPEILSFAVVACLYAVMRSLSKVTVSAKGLTINGLFTFRWEEIEAAQFRKLLGNDYLVIQRNKRMIKRYWLTLDIERFSDFRKAVIAMSPGGNPVHRYFAAEGQ